MKFLYLAVSIFLIEEGLSRKNKVERIGLIVTGSMLGLAFLWSVTR